MPFRSLSLSLSLFLSRALCLSRLLFAFASIHSLRILAPFPSSSSASDSDSDSDAARVAKADARAPWFSSHNHVGKPCKRLMQESTSKLEPRKLWIPVYVKKFLYTCSMHRLQERILGLRWTSTAPSGGDIWLLGVCHKASDSVDDSGSNSSFPEFQLDFQSRIWLTYRDGFEAIENSKLTSDAGWGCMIRSGQMLLAQALVCHYLGRAWRRKTNQPYPEEYFEILQYFGDSPSRECVLSIHNLLDVGKPFELSPGAWLGPYAFSCAVERLAKRDKKPGQRKEQKQNFPMVVYVVAGDAEGERGGAPILCKDDVVRACMERMIEPEQWAALLILIPLVLGLDKINPRYLPALRETFCFPQSLGIIGGKPGASTYLVGVQDDQVLYLDPHQVQQYVKISPSDKEVDTSSYHCSVVRRMPLNSIDPSLALGFYCQTKEDFDDLCVRASQLAEQSNGAPMFTVEECRRANLCTNFFEERSEPPDFDGSSGDASKEEAAVTEDEWQIL